MRIARLEIFGFKSFRDRFILEFDRDLVGIVGPNGCGKSNIIDALRWVLGESHARQLRGNVQEDLIFSGSETRKPMGMAEVSVTFRSSPGWVPAISEEIDEEERKLIRSLVNLGVEEEEAGRELELEASELKTAGEGDSEKKTLEDQGVAMMQASAFTASGIFEASEIQITRRLYRSGESEFFINRVPCRLKDIVDFCRAIGLGSRGLNIVQQGSIGDLVTRKPVERRELLEVAAGISGFRARLEVALRQLDRTNANIQQLRSLFEEVGKNVKVLKRQAARARSRAEQKAKLRILEEWLFSAKRWRLIEGRKLSENKIAELQITQNEYAERMENCHTVYHEALAHDAHLENLLRGLQTNRQDLLRALQKEQEEQHQKELELTRLEARVKATENQLSQIDEREEALKHETENRKSNIGSLGTQAEQYSERKKQLEGDLATLQQIDAANNEGNPGSVTRQYATEIAELSGRVERLGALGQEVAKLSSDLESQRRALKEKRDKLHARRVAVAALEAEVRSLEAQLRALADHVVKSVSDALAQESETSHQVLLASLKVPQRLQRAVAAIVAERSQYLVAQEAWDMARSFARRPHNGQARFGVVVGGSKEETEWSNLLQISDAERAIAPSVLQLSNSISNSPETTGVIENMIGGVLVVDSLDEALDLADYYRKDGWKNRSIVTLAGEVVTSWGWYTTTGEGAGLSLARRLEEQQIQAQGHAADCAQLVEEVSVLEQITEQVEKNYRQKEDERLRLIQDQRRLSQLLQLLRDAESRERKEALDKERQAQSRVRAVAEQLTLFQSRVDHENRRLGELAAEKDDLARKRQVLREQLSQLKIEHLAMSEQLKMAHAQPNQDEDTDGLRGRLRRVEEQIAEGDEERRSSREKVSYALKQVEALRGEHDEVSRRITDARLSVERASTELEIIEEQYLRLERLEQQGAGNPSMGEQSPEEQTHEPIVNSEQLARDGADQTDSLDLGANREEPKHIFTFDAQRESELKALESAGSLDRDIRDKEAEADKIRRALEREGEVDADVITRYEGESKRHEEMSLQLGDLESAAVTLDRTVKFLKEVSRQRFLKTFRFVSNKFEELVPRLFGGGMGKMDLTNPEDPLMSGVELIIRPPGKQLKSLDLMSGGEKALGAVAILIAMFLYRPGPLCVMDEVDAPLDDANLGKFMELVREISERTQFLVVTHNKQTMSMVDRLIGITMQERGVSTALEVSFEEAESELEGWLSMQ